MKKLNIPLIVFLAVGSMVTVIGVHLLHGYQVSRSADHLLARAQEAERNGDVDEQIRLLQRYLRHRPQDLENLKVLLETSRKRLFTSEDVNPRAIGQLLHSLEKAIRDNPEDVGLRRQGYIFSYSVGRFSDAMDHLEQLKVLGEITPEDRVVMARCLWRTGDTDAAEDELGALIGFDRATKTFDDERAEAPETIEAYQLLAVIHLQNDRTSLDVPRAIVEKAIERNPESPNAYLCRAGFLQENVPGDEGKQKSMEDIDVALKLAPDDANIILAAASTALMLGDFARAEALTEDGLKKHPDNADMYAKRAEVARAQNQTEQALAFINQGLEKLQLNRELLFRRGSYEVDLGRLDEARSTIERLGRRFDPVRVEILESRLLMANKDYNEAANRLEKLRSMGASGRASAMIEELINTCNRHLNRLDLALENNSNSPQAFLVQAVTLIQLGHHEEATQIINQLMQNKDVPEEQRERMAQTVFPLLIQIERAKPASKRDWTRVDQLAAFVKSKLRLDGPSAAQFDIELLVQKDMSEEARALAERAVLNYQTSPRLRLLLAQLTPDPEIAIRMLDQLQRTAADSAIVRVTKADKIEKLGGSDVEAKLRELESHSFSDPQEITTLYHGLVGIYRRASMHDNALRLLRELLKLHPKDLGMRVLSFDVAFEAQDPAAMEEMLNEIASVVKTESPEWQVAEARRLLWMHANKERNDRQLAEALRLLELAQNSRRDFAPIYMVRAEVQLERGEKNAAVDSIKTALEKRPNEVSYLQRMIDLLISLERHSEIGPYLERLPEEYRRPQDILAIVRMNLGKDPQKAMQLAESIFPPTSDDPTTLMYLVEIYEAAGAIDRCVPVLKRAIELDPTQPRPYVVQVRSLVRLGKADEAKATIEAMKSSVRTENPQFWLGQCYATVGDVAAAEEAYAEAVKKEPGNTVLLRNQALLFMATQQTEKLVACLEHLCKVDDDEQQAKVDVAWGRRTLAQHLGSSADYQDFQKGVDLLEENADTRGELHDEDLLVWLRLHANRPDAASRQKAVDKLAKVQNERQLTSGEKAILAYLHYTAGRWDDARQLMVELLANNPNNLGFITTYVEWLLERKEFDEATVWIRKLDPKSVESIKYSAILLVLSNRPKDAMQRIVSLVPRQIDEVTAARLLEDVAKYDKRFYEAARRQWATVVQKNPQAIHSYIAYLTRMPEGTGLEQALKLSESQLAQAVKDQRADIADYYLNLGIKSLRAHRKHLPANSPHFEQVRGWFETARQAKVNDLILSWREVDYYDVRREYDRLVALYQALLKRTDLSSLEEAVVRNNLAFIYAITNKGPEALKVIGDTISKLGPQSDFLDTRGLAYLASGDFDRAIEDLRAAVEGGEGDASKYFHLALAEHYKGNAAEARAAYQSSMEMGFDEADLSTPELKLYQQLKREMDSQLQDNELSQVRSQN